MDNVHKESAEGLYKGSYAAYLQPLHLAEKRCNVLFLCPDNSISSIMAEALLRRWGGDDFRAFSAGIVPRGEIHPIAADFLRVHRFWRPDLRSKGYQEFVAPESPQMDFVISVGEREPDGLPQAWPGHPRVIHWHITEPAIADGSPAEKANRIRKTSRELENRIRLFVLVNRKEARKNKGALGKLAAVS